VRTRDGLLVDLGTLGGEHSFAAGLAEGPAGTLRIAGHSHDAGGDIRAVLWTVSVS